MHIRNHAGQDEEQSAHGQQPAKGISRVPEQDSHAKQQRYERDPETVRAPERPIGADDADLVEKKISADARHHKPDSEFAQSAGRAAYVSKSTGCHAQEHSRVPQANETISYSRQPLPPGLAIHEAECSAHAGTI